MFKRDSDKTLLGGSGLFGAKKQGVVGLRLPLPQWEEQVPSEVAEYISIFWCIIAYQQGLECRDLGLGGQGLAPRA